MVDPTVAATAATALLELLAPSRCLACRRRGAPVEGVWCDRCARELTPAPAPACPRCAGPRAVGHGCWPPGAPIASTLAVHDYRGPLAAAVVAAKVGGAHAAWPALAAQLADRVATHPPPVDVVTWVATDRGRARRRGVDHARVLAGAVAAAVGAPAVALLRPPSPGAGDQRAARDLPGTAVLLVDDVLTTGRTAAAAAGALVAAGADAVHLAVLARAGDHPLVAPGPHGPRPA